jgi:hypothetical protein
MPNFSAFGKCSTRNTIPEINGVRVRAKVLMMFRAEHWDAEGSLFHAEHSCLEMGLFGWGVVFHMEHWQFRFEQCSTWNICNLAPATYHIETL